MGNNIIKLNENQLHSIITECMEKILMEDYNKGVDMEISDEEQRKKHILKLDQERKLSNAMIYFRRAQEEIRKGISQLDGKHKVEIYLEGESSFLPMPRTDYKCVGNIRIDGKVVG